MRSALACLLVAAPVAQSLRAPTPADVAAARARASTPVRPDRPVPASAIPSGVVDLAAMWVNATAVDAATNGTDCRAFLLQYELSLRLMPERAPLTDVFDSLRLADLCGLTLPPPPASGGASSAFFLPWTASQLDAACTVAPFYVDPVKGDDGNGGTVSAPFRTISRAVAATRAARAPGSGTACIVLRGGTHFLPATQVLSAADSGLVVTAFDGDALPAWVSGGTPLGSLSWQPSNTTGGMNVWVADVPPSLGLDWMPGLQTLVADDPTAVPTRLFPAYYPNTFNIEYFSGMGSLPGQRQVSTWHKPPILPIPQLYYKDLDAMGLKNDSTMVNYNVYAAGSGPLCSHWQQPNEDMWAYVCSNATAGGWEEIERGFATTGQLGFPIGASLNNSELPPNVASWAVPAGDGTGSGWPYANTPILTQWHNQGWFQASYAVTGISQAGGTYLNLSADGVFPAGGWQGGRTIENCKPDNLDPSEPLCSGPWYIRNVQSELDAPGEYFFDAQAHKLYLYYNATPGTPPPPSFQLVSSQLEVFFNLSGSGDAPVTDVTFAGLGFRDQRHAQLERWADPSGGDWALRRAGLFHLEGTERVTVSGSTFYRTDANAIMIAGYNRNATVIDNEFAYVGMTCIATFGDTVQDDGTAGTQPWGTVLAYNKAHEIGQYQLQSSLWFTSRATLTRVEGAVVFNIPRAAVNFNDAFGGGNNISRASIWNTCRQSGDHGPINSWDRMPFLTDIASGGVGAPSYTPAYTETAHSMIIANYGASQGFDNDDGSSWYDTHDNFFYDASGFKMDYGGHDSRFHSNVVVALRGQNCLGTASFVAGHATEIYDNDCVVVGTERVDDLFENCDSHLSPNVPVRGYNNRFYTQQGNASATCDCCGLRPITGAWAATIEANASAFPLPSGDTIITWGRQKTGLGPIPTASAAPTSGSVHTVLATPSASASRAAGPSLSCGPSLCFASGFGSGAVLAMAPSSAAVYGSAPANSTGQVVTVSLLPASAASPACSHLYTDVASCAPLLSVTAPVNADGTWKALLPPQPAGGNFTVTASCPTCGSTAVAFDVTFGMVFFLSGQSNAWLPLWFTFERNVTTAAVANHSYDNVRIWRGGLGKLPAPAPGGNWVGPAGPQPGSDSNDALTNQWRHPFDLLPPTTPEFRPGEPWLWEFPALGFYTATYLTDLIRASGATPPPIGVMSVPVGGTMIEEWVDFNTQTGTCSNITCMCTGSGCDQHQSPLSPLNCTGNADLYRGNIEPFVNTTITGWWYLQGENNIFADAGSSAYGTGYGCMFPTLLSSWRAIWSATPGTTPPDASFGFVTLADGTDEGSAVNMAQLRWSQTANYGYVPNPALPHTYMALAHDAGDPWDADSCAMKGCCVDSPEPLGPECEGDHRGQWSYNGTSWFMGAIHPRAKGIVGARLAQAAYATYFDETSPATGPVLAGCTLEAGGNRLQVRFNASLLAGQNVTWSPGATVAAENTALYVLVNATLPPDAAENHHGPGNSYRGPFANGNEFGVEGWIPVNAAVGPGPNSITIDLTFLQGERPTAVRYAWGGSGQGAPFQARMCCGPTVDITLEPCAPASCPLKMTGPGALPAVPFIAAINTQGQCECIAPQTCNG